MSFSFSNSNRILLLVQANGALGAEFLVPDAMVLDAGQSVGVSLDPQLRGGVIQNVPYFQASGALLAGRLRLLHGHLPWQVAGRLQKLVQHIRQHNFFFSLSLSSGGKLVNRKKNNFDFLLLF
jgi:hypothetical protein